MPARTEVLLRPAASSVVGPSGVTTGLLLWLAADSGGHLWQESTRITPATQDGDPVGAWDDVSGAGRNALEATVGKRPLLKLAIQNGKPVLRFDGVDDWMATPSITFGSAYTVIMAVIAPTINKILLESGPNTNSSAGFLLYSGSPNGQVFGGSGGPFTYGGTDLHAVGMQVLTTLATSAATADVFKNGTSQGPQTRTFGTIGAVVVNVGARSGGTLPLNGDIAEVIVYDHALTTGDRQLVERGLGTKYGVTVA